MLTKQQKIEQVNSSVNDVKRSKAIIFADFTGISTSELKSLRSVLREVEGKFKVIKKRLLNIALRQCKVDIDPTKFDSQVGTIFVNSDLFNSANKIYKLIKELARAKKDLKVLGGFDLIEKKNVSPEEFVIMAKLPSREILLTQIAVMFTMPIKKLIILLNQRAKKMV